ncbi:MULTISPECIES: MerR family DNA-binding transcriptional regulator [unclassified Janthinobacterium]|uniref:MerR family DNA-binding transcriptional regulator n=1 Tax=unclassified Janthinobacterium TaxID=2610881 RepID=UPI00034538F8|nr:MULTISPECIES: MerR family DNA-binding transcriptional regulator [unclassified Janthinobacterium]MEC5162101.1 hypothetical protein [Janthinobacterium sp. CG_S6]
MYIGGISKLTGASPKAIRHYESLGLILGPPSGDTYCEAARAPATVRQVRDAASKP